MEKDFNRESARPVSKFAQKALKKSHNKEAKEANIEEAKEVKEAKQVIDGPNISLPGHLQMELPAFLSLNFKSQEGSRGSNSETNDEENSARVRRLMESAFAYEAKENEGGTLPCSETKAAFIAVVGNTNVGKSTLVNKLVGAKISIVTPKVQTTRARIRAILTEGNTQLVFTDTPGIFIPKKTLERHIIKNAWQGFAGVDIIILVIDPRYKIDDSFKGIVRRLSDPAILVINKIDLIEKGGLLALAAELNELYNFERTFMISALKNSGVKDLRKYLFALAPPGIWHYNAEDETDMPLKFNLAELTREKLFLRLHQELPYSLTVETEAIIEKPDKTIVNQVIYVNHEGHKKIVIGTGGEAIKKVRLLATAEMEKLLQKTVNLFLFIKVRANWEDKAEILSTVSY